ncbi:alpha/beta hydrolase [Loktanella sp. IMCC34160]|uniref:alpha/beta hydrolase n=1 Tax=Loktanella sp. IMCC34160 TaxID=2510646 RepID=UPI0013ECB06E|nr:alpha/beta hydrolase [Loktanella sp. IMCC34160]
MLQKEKPELVKQPDDISGLIYGTSVNADSWHQLMEAIGQAVLLSSEEDLEYASSEEASKIENILRHFNQACAIADKMLAYQETNQFLEQSLAHLAFGLAFFDDEGELIWANTEMLRLASVGAAGGAVTGMELVSLTEVETRSAKSWVRGSKNLEVPIHLRLDRSDTRSELLLLPRQQIEKYGFSVRAAAALINVDVSRSDAVALFAQKYGLTRREKDLVSEMLSGHDMRMVASNMGVTYETARSYAKKVFEKTGCTSQAQLNSRIIDGPASILRARTGQNNNTDLRRMFTMPSGRQVECFVLGPKNGSPVLVLQSNFDLFFNVLDNTDEIAGYLETQNIRVFLPQWPGTYRSDYATDSFACWDYCLDIVEIASQLGFKSFAVYAKAYSTNCALSLAYRFPERIDKLVLASAYNSNMGAENLRNTEFFFRLTNLLATKWPAMGRSVLKLMWRQAAQDPSKLARILARSATCQADREILLDPNVVRTEHSLIQRRQAQGFKGQIQRSMNRFTLRAFPLGGIKTPVEIYNCDTEMVTPLVGAQMLAEELPNCNLHVLHNEGHYHYYRNWPWMLARAAGRDMPIRGLLAKGSTLLLEKESTKGRRSNRQ